MHHRSRRRGRVWKLPDPWTQRTRPPILAKPQNGFAQAPTRLINISQKNPRPEPLRISGQLPTDSAEEAVDVLLKPQFVAFDSVTGISLQKNNFSFGSFPNEVIVLFSHGGVAARFLVAKQEKDQDPIYISALLVLCHNVK
jgi:hypothetical protein